MCTHKSASYGCHFPGSWVDAQTIARREQVSPPSDCRADYYHRLYYYVLLLICAARNRTRAYRLKNDSRFGLHGANRYRQFLTRLSRLLLLISTLDFVNMYNTYTIRSRKKTLWKGTRELQLLWRMSVNALCPEGWSTKLEYVVVHSPLHLGQIWWLWQTRSFQQRRGQYCCGWSTIHDCHPGCVTPVGIWRILPRPLLMAIVWLMVPRHIFTFAYAQPVICRYIVKNIPPDSGITRSSLSLHPHSHLPPNLSIRTSRSSSPLLFVVDSAFTSVSVSALCSFDIASPRMPIPLCIDYFSTLPSASNSRSWVFSRFLSLELCRNRINDKIATNIAEMLKSNKTLKKYACMGCVL